MSAVAIDQSVPNLKVLHAVTNGCRQTLHMNKE
jgi:hypothetical protein